MFHHRTANKPYWNNLYLRLSRWLLQENKRYPISPKILQIPSSSGGSSNVKIQRSIDATIADGTMASGVGVDGRLGENPLLFRL